MSHFIRLTLADDDKPMILVNTDHVQTVTRAADKPEVTVVSLRDRIQFWVIESPEDIWTRVKP